MLKRAATWKPWSRAGNRICDDSTVAFGLYRSLRTST